MDKETYYKKSREQGLPSRCPILKYCSRRAWTIYFLNRYFESDPHKSFIQKMREVGEIPIDFEEKEIDYQGESPGGSLGEEIGWFHDLCPEVQLFDTMNSFMNFRGTACSSGSYDIEMSPKTKIIEEKHFSECVEFSTYLFEHKSFTFSGKNKSNSMSNPCYTYLMLDKTHKLYKIGISNSPKYRERTLQGQQPNIELLAIKKFESRRLAKNFETELHLAFKEFRIRGEWFELNSEQLQKVIDLLNEK